MERWKRLRAWRAERASVTVMTAGSLVLLALLGLGVARIGAAAAARTRAQAAADAAALAGVIDGRESADRLAAANGGRITSYQDDGTELEVEVQVDDAVAVARAFRKDPPPRVVVLDPPSDTTVLDTVTTTTTTTTTTVTTKAVPGAKGRSPAVRRVS